MTIMANGRYRDSTVSTLAVGNLPRQVIVPRPPVPYTFRYRSYIWTGADRLDSVADSVYGDPSKWWAIAAGNPEIMDWSIIWAGTIIRIPTLT